MHELQKRGKKNVITQNNKIKLIIIKFIWLQVREQREGSVSK